MLVDFIEHINLLSCIGHNNVIFIIYIKNNYLCCDFNQE
jgi:hypothetical protein